MRAADIASADEIFLTGTAAEVVPVCEVDDTMIGDGECGRITRRIQEQFRRIVLGQDMAYRNWLQPVYGVIEVRA